MEVVGRTRVSRLGGILPEGMLGSTDEFVTITIE
jgi:hypothetical protein